MKIIESILLFVALSSLLSASVQALVAPSPLPVSHISEVPSSSPSPSPSPSYSSSSEPASDPVLQKICSTTGNPLDCLTSIAPFITGETDPISVLKMAIQATIAGTEKVVMKVSEMEKDPSTSPEVASCLDACKENYGYVVDSLHASVDALSAHDNGKLSSELSAVVTFIGTCKDVFAEAGMELPSEMNYQGLKKLASNNLAISELIRS